MVKITVALGVVVVALGGCSGHYLAIPDEAGARDVDVTVAEITPALVIQQRQDAVRAQEALPQRHVQDMAASAYRIGPGDVLDLSIPSIADVALPNSTVLREPDRGYTVAPDGTTWIPYAGAVDLNGATVREAQERVTAALTRYVKNPQVRVSIREFRSQKALVAGQVPRPGYQPISDVPLTLLGALTAAGSTPQLRSDLVARPIAATALQNSTESADYRRVQLTRDGATQTVDVLALLRSPDPARQDPLLKNGDTIYVPPVARSYVYVLGEVRTPALIEIVERRTSLAEVLVASGGFNQQTSKASRVYVLRGELMQPRVFQLDANQADALLLADAFTVQPRDVVYVAEANISRWNRFLTQLVPTVQSLISGGILAESLSD